MDILYTKMKILGMANTVHASLFSDCKMFNVSCDCLSLNLKSLRNTCNIDRKYVEDITKSKKSLQQVIFICTGIPRLTRFFCGSQKTALGETALCKLKYRKKNLSKKFA